MTQNQIRYWELQETQRSNLAKEAETQRSNVAKEAETARSNRQQEAIGFGKLDEDVRSHLMNEYLTGMQLEEVARHNTVVEGETIRSNLAKEHETQRHNTIEELIKEGSLQENVRSNKAQESIKYYDINTNKQLVSDQTAQKWATTAETERTNKAKERETERSNRAQEKLKGKEISVKGGTSALDSGIRILTTLVNVGAQML